MVFEIINSLIYLISTIAMTSLYFVSLQPAKREKKYGIKVWDQSKTLREIAQYLQILTVINLILWIWFPLPIVDKWTIFPAFWIGLIIGIVIIIFGAIIMMKGVKDAGAETYTPLREGKMHGGIYKHIRHPQSTGEIPVYLSIGLLLNSWFILEIIFIFLIIYIPLMIYIEENDLIRRFGDQYREYKKTTGALIPKIK